MPCPVPSCGLSSSFDTKSLYPWIELLYMPWYFIVTPVSRIAILLGGHATLSFRLYEDKVAVNPSRSSSHACPFLDLIPIQKQDLLGGQSCLRYFRTCTSQSVFVSTAPVYTLLPLHSSSWKRRRIYRLCQVSSLVIENRNFTILASLC